MPEKFESQAVAEMIDVVEKIARDYELAIKKYRFDTKCPYPEIIEFYKNIKQILINYDWNDQVMIFSEQIKFYKDKLERDKKLREIEIQKEQRQKEIEELYKIKEIDTIKAVILSLNKEEMILDIEEEEKERRKEAEEIFNMIDNAERMAKEYEKEIKRGRILDLECPYKKIIEIYKKAERKFENIGWKDESGKLLDSIEYYYSKLEKDKKLREIEAKK